MIRAMQARSLWASAAAASAASSLSFSIHSWLGSGITSNISSLTTSRSSRGAAKPEPLQLLVLEASLAALAKKAAPLPTGGIKSTKAWYDFRAPEGQTPPWTCQKITPLLPTFSQASTHLGWLWIIGHSELVSFFHGHHDHTSRLE